MLSYRRKLSANFNIIDDINQLLDGFNLVTLCVE